MADKLTPEGEGGESARVALHAEQNHALELSAAALSDRRTADDHCGGKQRRYLICGHGVTKRDAMFCLRASVSRSIIQLIFTVGK